MKTIYLSKESEKIVEIAQSLAESYKHCQIDSPHVFWSLIINNEKTRKWLKDSGCGDIQKLLENLEKSSTKWYGSNFEASEVSPDYIQIMRISQEIAIERGSESISPDHLLAAIIKHDKKLNEWLIHIGLRPTIVHVSGPLPLLDEMGRDITKLASEGKLPSVIGRNYEVGQVIEVLLRRGKNSVLLLGLPGVGKTAIVERLAQDIVKGDVPPKLKNTRIIELNVSGLLAGTSYRGQLEEKLQELLKELKRADDVILVIDEFHTLVGAGSSQDSSLDAANVLKPALSTGEITCIGITTQNEYSRFVEKDQALVRRFHSIIVNEPSEEETCQILKEILGGYETHHNVVVQEKVPDLIVHLASQYLSSRQFPDKAIDILAKACSRAEIQQINEVDEEIINKIVGEMVGVPIGRIGFVVHEILAKLEETLSSSVIGQEQAVKTLSQAVRLAYAGLRDPNRPRGIFLFVGPSGVGKTQLARSLSEVLFGNEKALIRLDMSEYSEKYTVSRLIGAAPGYVGYEEPGQLTQPLRDRPYSVVLFDEIEKAHPEFFDIFLQLFDAGRLTDSHGNIADGRHAIFIMTSNLGAKAFSKTLMGFNKFAFQDPNKEVETAVRTFFRPEFLNRIDHIIYFNSLTLEDFSEIAQQELQKVKDRLKEQGIRLSYSSEINDIIAIEASKRSGAARGIKGVVEEMITVPISDLVINTKPGAHNWIHAEVERNSIRLGWV